MSCTDFERLRDLMLDEFEDMRELTDVRREIKSIRDDLDETAPGVSEGKLRRAMAHLKRQLSPHHRPLSLRTSCCTEVLICS